MREVARFLWERRAEILALTGQHVALVLAATSVAVAIAVPLGVALTRRVDHRGTPHRRREHRHLVASRPQPLDRVPARQLVAAEVMRGIHVAHGQHPHQPEDRVPVRVEGPIAVSVVVASHARHLRLRWLLNAFEEQTLAPERWEVVVRVPWGSGR